MEILVVTGTFPPDIGGPAGYVPKIAKYLSERGHEVRVLTLSDKVDFQDDHLPYHVTRLHRSSARPLRILRCIYKIWVLSRQADLVYVNGLDLEASIAAKLSRTPTVHKIVGDYAWERARRWGWFNNNIDVYQCADKGVFLKLLDATRTLPLKRARNVIVPSRYLKQIVTNWGIEDEKVEVVYNAVQSIDEEEIEHYPLPPYEGDTALTISRLVPWKGIGSLLQALEDIPDTRLVIAGDGPNREKYETEALERNIENRVLFLGAVPKPAIPSVLRQADVFVLNSTYEGLPHVVLEAMREKVPVLATDAGGTGELVKDGETGRLIPVEDKQALRAVLQEMLQSSSNLGKFVEKAYEQLNGQFSYQRMTKETENVLIASDE